LWAHECGRVFRDRLINEEDSDWFDGALAAQVKETFRKDFATAIFSPIVPEGGAQGTVEALPLLYGSFVDQKTRKYQQVTDAAALHKTVNQFLDDYNQTVRGAKMDLVLFMNAVEHVARISRIIQLPLGNALLVGVGGSGRKSLTKLSVFMAEMSLFQVEITKTYNMVEWRDDLKKVLMMAGKDGKPTVFLFSDTQIVSESFVEDINNILNIGEVPNLWESDERAMILDDCSRAAKKEKRLLQTPDEIYSYFIERCRSNLHLVLCFSPIGEAFRRRLRMFPSLVNCCAIDWFSAWPEEALRSVAQSFLQDDELDMDEATTKGVIDVCVDMQRRTATLSDKYLSELRRHFYVTPTSYLELISTFKALINDKRSEILNNKRRYEAGLDKLAETQSKVGGMQEELNVLKPQLKVAQE